MTVYSLVVSLVVEKVGVQMSLLSRLRRERVTAEEAVLKLYLMM